ncbi:nucleotide disphospho-sugar-binding domain-containing protein [Mycolicibacterium smegmatis]|uniref:nucleotide disphospho-sugar-binding domain-containing protein n=1 Tax=Mycolicibacterium smegmatis TaxID=1772 RepID=UPI001EFB7C46|nr:glycosyltransferase [Mycolicibacterium smegmatis]ULN33396.1 glycosyltransferase [Mycolicibacterium smegmatis]
MADILIASHSPIGHIGPLLNVAYGLVGRGDRVTVLTSAQHTDAIRASGAVPVALPDAGDPDADRLDIENPKRARTSGIARINVDIVAFFVAPMAHQADALAKLLAQHRFDAVIADYGFFGILPFLLGNRADRPPFLTYSTTPLMLSSRDTAPAGLGLPPPRHAVERLRNRALETLTHKVLLRASQRAVQEQLHRMNCRPLPVFLFDGAVLSERVIAPTVPQFDYHRSDLPKNVRYVGAVHPMPNQGFRRPMWWRLLDGDRPVVHVTQGTVDNTDLTRLLEPTLEALADEDVVVIASTGGRDLDVLRTPVPANTYVAKYIPHDLLMPKVDVLVTNGGYGTVQRALSCGVPLVVAGKTEDKPEVAARVAWSGAGIDLRTGTPTPAAIRDAVREVLTDKRYLSRARTLEAAFAQRDGVAEIIALVDEVIAEHRAEVGGELACEVTHEQR